MNAPAALAAILPATLTPPMLGTDEINSGLVLENNAWHWVILLPGECSPVNWKTAMTRAKEQGGDLPSRPEQSVLYANLRGEFEEDWYWSNTPYAGAESSAWYQYFGDGGQGINPKGNELRARAVRRVAI